MSAATLRMMRPLARALMQFGIGWKEFDQLARRAFVEVASRDYGLRGRPTNLARVAAMTGLSRKEVRRIRELPADNLDVGLAKRSRPAELLHHWFTDACYLDRDHRPLLLPYAGAYPSFTSLVRHTGGDLSAAAMRRELLRAGAIAETPDGRLHALRREFIPADACSRLVEGLRFGLRGLLATVLHNATPGTERMPRFQRVVHCEGVPPDRVPQARRAIHAVLTRSAETLDSHLRSVEAAPTAVAPSACMRRVSVGIYYFQDDATR